MSARALSLALLVAATAPARAAGPGAALEVRVQADRAEVSLHEQVLLRVEVTHPLWARPRWEAPVFEGFWAERLSSLGGPLEARGGGEPVRTTTFRRALFPTRTGELAIDPSVLHYRDPDDIEHTLELPATRIRVVALPDHARPEGFQGVVGQLRVETRASAEVLELGESLPVQIEVYGSANTWDVATPDLEAALGEKFEVFPDPPRLRLGEQGDKLTARRTFGFEVVPGETGRHHLPVVAVPYFDPDARRYRVARSEPVAFRVLARGALARLEPWESPSRTPSPMRSPWLSIGLVMALVGALCAWSLTRWWRRTPHTWKGPTPPPPHTLFESACAAVGTDRFPGLLAQAVKARIHVRHHLDALALSSEEIAERIDDRQALELLRALDRTRFGRRDSNPHELLASARRYLDL